MVQVGPVAYHPYCGIVAEEEKEQIKQNVKGKNKVRTSECEYAASACIYVCIGKEVLLLYIEAIEALDHTTCNL